ncbi:transmembrane 220 family protein [Flavobacteriaceae bacterium XHP0103]|uniref:transmembrane 220 family protein n=1 Tax=Marixanthotalea marina TaxID=2844359 RepID=UPI002989BCAB|nr:transmembrane 220 family protein [Marixanthotalea marina]MBU3820961.1 transmembrane 220 family protein [Marixanthotalea marina]
MNSKTKQSKLRVLINVILFIVFALFAVVQLNDPDPIHWFLVYGAVAVISLLANFINMPKQLMWILVIGLLIYSGFHLGYFIDWLQIEDKNEIFGEMVYEKPYLEGTREFLGLILAALGLSFQLKN